MSEKTKDFNPFDPAGMFKTMRDANLDAWSKMMIQLVNTDAYGQATGTMLDAWLATSAPFRQVAEKLMAQVLSSLNMPARTEVINLAEHLTNIEMRLDDLDAKLDLLLRDQKSEANSQG